MIIEFDFAGHLLRTIMIIFAFLKNSVITNGKPFYRLQRLTDIRHFLGTVLLIGFLLPMGLREVHFWTAHHDAPLHCEAGKGRAHIHNEAYAPDHCHYWTIHYSQYLGYQIPAEPAVTPEATVRRGMPSPVYFNQIIFLQSSPRAPPFAHRLTT